MSASVSKLPAVPPEVQEFAAKVGVGPYLNAVLDLACGVYPGRLLAVLLEADGVLAVRPDQSRGGRPHRHFAGT